MSVRSVAVFEYEQNGRLIKTAGASARGRGHAERVVWRDLQSRGVLPEQVRRIYTELEPCVVPGGYCKLWLARTFPHAEVTFSFKYGADVRSRMEGLHELAKATS